MDIEELVKKLANVGVKSSRKTLRRWADHCLIENHPHTSRSGKLSGKGRGNAEEWPDEAVEQAAAVWAVQRAAAPKRLSRKTIRGIRRVAEQAFITPKHYYEWPSNVVFSGPDPGFYNPEPPHERYNYRILKIQFRDDDAFGLFNRLVMLREGWPEFLYSDKRLTKLLDDKQVVDVLDRYAKLQLNDLEAILEIITQLRDVRCDVPSDLVKTWVATLVKVRNCAKISSPKKVVFHWHSTIHEPELFEKGEVTLEEPDPTNSILAGFDEGAIAPEEPKDEDEVVILIDEIDVRKRMFFAPPDEWNATEHGGELRVLDVYNVSIEVFDRKASLAFTRPERLLTVDEIFEQRAQGYTYLARPEKEIARYVQSGHLNALELTYNDLLDCVEAQGTINNNGWYLASAKIARAVERHPEVVHTLFDDTSGKM